MSTLPKVEYFVANSEELGSLKKQINAFMEKVKPAHVNIGQGFHYDAEEQHWEIIVVATYQEQLPQQAVHPGSPLFMPKPPGVH